MAFMNGEYLRATGAATCESRSTTEMIADMGLSTELANLTDAEVQQLQAIGTITIPAAQWGILSGLFEQSAVAGPEATAVVPDALTAGAIAAPDATSPGTGADATTPSGAEYATCAALTNELKVDYAALLVDVTSIRTQLVALIADTQANKTAVDAILSRLEALGLFASA